MTPYGKKALEAECHQVATAGDGTRNDTLNRAAFNLMQIVNRSGGDDLAEMEAYDGLVAAAQASGLGLMEANRTIGSAIRGAREKPRDPKPVSVNPVPEGVLPYTSGIGDGNGVEALENPYIPVDWHTAWAGATTQAWLLEPIIPMGGQTVLYSEPKVGKSLLSLEIAAALAVGRRWVLGAYIDEPITVLYVDHENRVETDIVGRLEDMGYTPGQLDNLKLASYPRAAVLDTHLGGLQLVTAAKDLGAKLVIIDTVSRTIAGEENSNDTWLAFYRHTGQLLKAAGIALLRLDHSGKDHAKGQRGGSAKSGDVDLVWRMETVVEGETYTLKCEAHRVVVADTYITIKRGSEPLVHTVDATGYAGANDAKAKALIRSLDQHGAPKDIGVVAATAFLRDLGVKVRNGSLTAAMLQARKLGTI